MSFGNGYTLWLGAVIFNGYILQPNGRHLHTSNCEATPFLQFFK